MNDAAALFTGIVVIIIAVLAEGYRQLDSKARLVFWQDFIEGNNIA